MPNVPALVADHAALTLSSFGETVTHRPLGESDDDADLSGIVTLQEPERIEQKGLGIKRRGTITVASSVSVSLKDQWQARGLWWQCIAFEPADAGLIDVHIQETEDEIRSGARTVL